jgi:pyruvate formate lyase activating enzyme
VKGCFKLGISINIDTCGFVQYDKFKAILPYIDTFLYDLKIMDDELHKQFTGMSNSIIHENLRKLSSDGAKIEIRLPLIDGVNCDDENINQTITFLKQINVHKVTLLPFHSIGIAKFGRIGLSYSNMKMEKPSVKTITDIKHKFESNNFTTVCDI